MTIQFTVYGAALPEARRTFGIERDGRRTVVNVRKPNVKAWMEDIRAQAIAHKPETLPLGAIRLAVEFVLPRPGYLMAPKYYWRCKSRKCGWKGATWEDPSGCPKCGGKRHLPVPTPPHTIKPDLTNLIKVTEDALKGLMWGDDSQVAEMRLTKRWAELGEQPHVDITISAASEEG